MPSSSATRRSSPGCRCARARWPSWWDSLTARWEPWTSWRRAVASPAARMRFRAAWSGSSAPRARSAGARAPALAAATTTNGCRWQGWRRPPPRRRYQPRRRSARRRFRRHHPPEPLDPFLGALQIFEGGASGLRRLRVGQGGETRPHDDRRPRTAGGFDTDRAFEDDDRGRPARACPHEVLGAARTRLDEGRLDRERALDLGEDLADDFRERADAAAAGRSHQHFGAARIADHRLRARASLDAVTRHQLHARRTVHHRAVARDAHVAAFARIGHALAIDDDAVNPRHGRVGRDASAQDRQKRGRDDAPSDRAANRVRSKRIHGDPFVSFRISQAPSKKATKP